MAVTPASNPLEGARLESEEREPSSWDPIDLLPVLAGNYVGARPDICSRTDGQTLLYPGRIHWLHGEPESGKSWLGLLAAAEVLETGLVAVLLDFEDDAYATVDRLRRIGVGDTRVFGNLRSIRPEEPLSIATLGRLRSEVFAGATLTVLDATTASMALDGLDPVSTKDTTTWLQKIPAAAAAEGAAVLVLDHVVKTEGERGRWAIGSQAKLAVVTGAAYALTARQPIAPGFLGHSTIVIAKDRPGAVRAASVGKVAGELMIDARDREHLAIRIETPMAPVAADGLRPGERLVLSVLGGGELEARGWRELGDRLVDQGHPLKKPTILNALRALADAGMVKEAQVDGRGSKVFWRGDSP
jgi:hypothetical protein